MTIERQDMNRQPSIALLTVGLALWLILTSLAAGFVATHSDSAAIQRVLNGMGEPAFSSPATD